MISAVDINNGQQWTTMDNNPRCYMHLWCRLLFWGSAQQTQYLKCIAVSCFPARQYGPITTSSLQLCTKTLKKITKKVDKVEKSWGGKLKKKTVRTYHHHQPPSFATKIWRNKAPISPVKCWGESNVKILIRATFPSEKRQGPLFSYSCIFIPIVWNFVEAGARLQTCTFWPSACLTRFTGPPPIWLDSHHHLSLLAIGSQFISRPVGQSSY